MPYPFPPDVSWRVDGNFDAAQKLFPAAGNLLYKALQYQQANGINDVRMMLPGNDGSLIFVVLSGALKHIYVTPGKPPEPAPPPREEHPPVEPPLFYPYVMWSGVARNTLPEVMPHVHGIPSDLPDSPGIMSALDQFHPDRITSDAYLLDFAWQLPHKLGINTDGIQDGGQATCAFPKPGNYSGSMKRFVQALFGLGIVRTLGPVGFIDEVRVVDADPVNENPDINVFNRFDYTWANTHGIHKSPIDGSIWNIEISKARGVLAMPMPIFAGTESPNFMLWLDAFGDTDTMSVVLEFGGLPTGEPIPTDPTVLADAITIGKVLQLLPAAALAEFYHDADTDLDKEPVWAGQGWAFSETGIKADNLTFWYKNPDCAVVDNETSGGDTDGLGALGPDQRFRSVQHWSMTLNLVATPTVEAPYGHGSALLELVMEQILYNSVTFDTAFEGLADVFTQPLMLAPESTGDLSTEFISRKSSILRGRPFGNNVDTPGDYALFLDGPANVTGVPGLVHLFYDGEVLEKVYHVPHFADFYFDVGNFTSTSIEMDILGLQGANQWGGSALAIPCYCREGYILIRADLTDWLPVVGTIPVDAKFPITFRGFFSQLGLFEYEPLQELVVGIVDGSTLLTSYTWSSLWLSTAAFDSIFQFYCGVNINAGQTRGYVMSDALKIPANQNYYGAYGDYGDYGGFGDVPGIYASRPARTAYLQPLDIADLAVPIETTAQGTTFIGSP